MHSDDQPKKKKISRFKCFMGGVVQSIHGDGSGIVIFDDVRTPSHFNMRNGRKVEAGIKHPVFTAEALDSSRLPEVGERIFCERTVELRVLKWTFQGNYDAAKRSIRQVTTSNSK